LNGPCTDPRTKYGGGYKYHLGFNAQTGRLYDRCLSDILRFIGSVGEPWFARFREVDDLLKLPDSPLSATEKLDLQAARAGKWNPSLVAASLKLFGIKE